MFIEPRTVRTLKLRRSDIYCFEKGSSAPPELRWFCSNAGSINIASLRDCRQATGLADSLLSERIEMRFRDDQKRLSVKINGPVASGFPQNEGGCLR